MKKPVYLKNVASLQLDEKKCVGCGMCITVCPHAVFTMNEKHAIIKDPDACMECGACANNCPAEAIAVKTGVGCASAVINSFLGRTDSSCCCVIEPEQKKSTCC